jgi:predicted nucleic acid-binding protein
MTSTSSDEDRPRTGDAFLIDSNVLLDVFTEDPVWLGWSEGVLRDAVRSGVVGINPIIYAEVSVRFDDVRDLDARLPAEIVTRLPLPFEAGFVAAKAHQAYRRRGGFRIATLPDFYIGAHALVDGLTLVTRDPRRYRSAYPGLRMLAPGGKAGPGAASP